MRLHYVGFLLVRLFFWWKNSGDKILRKNLVIRIDATPPTPPEAEGGGDETNVSEHEDEDERCILLCYTEFRVFEFSTHLFLR